MRFLLTFIGFLLILPISKLDSQTFNISQIQTQEFPTVKTVFIAKDRGDEYIQDAMASEFQVIENGINIPGNDVTVECFEASEKPELCIVLVVDRSGSMGENVDLDDPSSLTRFQWVEKGVAAFLNSIEFVGDTKVSLISFSNASVLNTDFTANKQEILDSLSTIKVQGPTKYDPPYISQEASVIKQLKDCPPKMQRICVFLTDGNPDVAPETQKIIDSLNYYNIASYNVTFLTEMNNDLDRISIESGGKSFEVREEEDLESIYTQIALELQKTIYCELSWQAPYACDISEIDRDVEIRFNRYSPALVRNRSYQVPQQGLAIRNWEEEIISFGNPEVGPEFGVERTFSLDIVNAPLQINAASLVPDNVGFSVVRLEVDGEEINFGDIIEPGSTIDITARFEQYDQKTFRSSSLILEGGPCEPIVELVGGTTDIILSSPNNGEVYTVCDNIPITWSGVTNNTPVHISYSADEFNADSNFIATSNNNIYNWNNIPQPGNYKVKLRVDPTENYMWVTGDDGPHKSVSRSIALSNNELFSYITGHFTDSLFLQDTFLVSTGLEDGYVAKYNSAGKLLWANSAGGLGVDSLSGICVDDDDNVYVTGSAMKSAKFGAQTLNLDLEGNNYFIISKLPPGGTNFVTRFFGAKNPYTNFNVWGTRILYNEQDELIEVRGQFTGDYEWITAIGSFTFSQPNNNTPGRFTAYYNKNLELQDFEFAYVQGDYSDDVEVTDDGSDTYTTGTTNSNLNLGSLTFKHSGSGDAFVHRYGRNEPSTDISEIAFTIEQPEIQLSETGTINFGDSPYRVTKDNPNNLFVINPKILPINIDSVSFTGTHPQDFSLDQSISGQLDPGQDEQKAVRLKFTPTAMGQRNAVFTIYGDCAEPISVNLTGNGVCELVSIDEVDLGNSNLNTTSSNTFTDIFTNNNFGTVRILPEIQNDAQNEFEIISINGDVNLVGQPFDVQGGESVDIEISFTPKESGNRNASLVYNSQTDGCEDISTLLKGTGVSTEISYSTQDFGRKRIYTVNTLSFYIKNNGQLTATLSGISLEDETHFRLNLPQDLTIPSNDSIQVEAIFNPQIEGNLQTPINFIVNPGDDPISLGNLEGVGENPTIDASLDCGSGSSTVGQQKNIDLILTNNSTVSETEIEELRLNQNSDYTFNDGTKTLNNVNNIPINGTLTIPLIFTPTANGIRTVDITSLSNTAVGNNTNDELDDPQEDIFSLSCEAINGQNTNLLDFEGVLLCTTREIEYSSVLNSNTDATIESISITGADANSFSYNGIQVGDVLTANTEYEFNVLFTPDAERTYNATLTYNLNENGASVTYNLNLSGEGKEIRFYSNQLQTDASPGEQQSLTVKADIPELGKNLNNLDVQFNYNSNTTEFERNQNNFVDVTTNLDWSWGLNKNSLNTLIASGSANTPQSSLNNQTVDLFNINYIIYLGDEKVSSIDINRPTVECLTTPQTVREVTLDSVCVVDIRLVTFGDNAGFEQPFYNDDTKSVNARFTVSFDNLLTTLEIYDISGNLIDKKSFGSLRRGTHEVMLPVAGISSGAYFIRIKSGPFTDTKKLMISK